jgi:2-keto-3-deoxy-L-rhamnonate aldolase RhmA
MTPNPVRKALRERSFCIGTWIQVGHAAVAEVLANAGFDWLCADGEHTDIGPAEFAAVARGLHGRGPVPLVRVRENDTLAIRQMLDMGALGVIVPLVNSAADAEAAVRAAKYPPQGVRGFAFHRGNDWGVDFADYAAQANAEIAVVVMIESREAVENIEEILAVEGVDGVFIGPYDMSGSYGLPGETAAPVIQRACARVVEACRNAGKSAGIHVVLPTPESVEQAVRQGFTFIAVGVDTVFLSQGARTALATARAAATG